MLVFYLLFHYRECLLNIWIGELLFIFFGKLCFCFDVLWSIYWWYISYQRLYLKETIREDSSVSIKTNIVINLPWLSIFTSINEKKNKLLADWLIIYVESIFRQHSFENEWIVVVLECKYFFSSLLRMSKILR